MTTFQKAFLATIAVLVFSLAYYLVIFLPQKEQLRLRENEKIRQENLLGLQECLQKTENIRNEFWNKNCSGLGLGDDCSLPSSNAKAVKDYYESYKDDCYKAYPQK